MGQPLRCDSLSKETVHGWFSAVTSAAPDRCAISDRGSSLTYHEVEQRSTAIADQLACAGVPSNSLVGLRLPRTALVPLTILGIFKHGCAYVPIDPEYPVARQEFILQDSGARFVVSADKGGDGQDGLTIEAIPSSGDAVSLPPRLAYAIYTSGSTGTPKGVLVGHDQIVALMRATSPLYDIGPDDVWTLFSAYSFDFSVWEMWGALLFGGRLIVVPAECARNPLRFAELLRREGVTILNQVPTAFSYLVRGLEEQPQLLDALRHVIFGGEEINNDAIERWRHLGSAPTATLTNMYGITECTVHVTYAPLSADAAPGRRGNSPIGRPLPHLEVHLRDEEGRAAAPGTPGEIVVSGTGVAFGYLNQPELTDERFISVEGVAGKAYRSGDWAFRDEQGLLHYIGRRDLQVQIRGFRIELGEIESAVAGHPMVGACVVIAPINALGEPVLIAHITSSGEQRAAASDLRRHVSAILPKHMVPAQFVHHAEFPLTYNGKVDRRALADQASQA